MNYAVFFEKLRLPFSIGVEPFEREWRQPLEISLRMEVDPGARAGGGYVSYVPVVEFLRALAAGPHIETIEEVAEAAAGRAFEIARVERVTVTVAKPSIFADTEAVGISMSWARGDLPG